MPATDAGFAKARQMFTEYGAMLRASKAIRLGIHPRALYAFGTPAKSNRWAADFTGCPRLRLSPARISFLLRFEFRAQVPHSVDLALPSHAQIPKIEGVPLACVLVFRTIASRRD